LQESEKYPSWMQFLKWVSNLWLDGVNLPGGTLV
jgi:hypothetical protein